MKQRIIRVMMLTVLATFAQWVFADERYIMRAPAPSVPAITSLHSLTMTTAPNAQGISTVTSSDSRTAAQVISELLADPNVQDIEHEQITAIPEAASGAQLSQSAAAAMSSIAENRIVSYFGVNAWSSYVDQVATRLTRLSDVQRALNTGTGVVAVIDTGVDPWQPVLQGSLIAGYDFIHNIPGTASEWIDLDPSTAAALHPGKVGGLSTGILISVNQSTAAILDQSTAAILDVTKLPPAFGHGTMVAGIIHLVAPTAQIMPLKAFGADGSGSLSDIVRAIYYAVDSGARVINMSFSMPTFSLALMKAVNYATAHKVVCVSSVGNSGMEIMTFPAGFSNVLGTASTDSNDFRSLFSNFGPAVVHIAAPGENVVTVYPGGNYAVVSGTSFAAPFVSGAAAVMVQVEPNLDQAKALHALSSGKKLDVSLGSARLDLYATVCSLRAMELYGVR